MCKELNIIGDYVIFRGYEVAKIKNKNKYPSIVGDFIDIIESADLLSNSNDLADDLDDIDDDLDSLADDIDDLASSLGYIKDKIRDIVDKLKGEE